MSVGARDLSPLSVKHCQCGSAAIASAASANGEHEVELRASRAEGPSPSPVWRSGWLLSLAAFSCGPFTRRLRYFAVLGGGFAPVHFRAGHICLCQWTGLGIPL